ncbi:MAG: hypothetical protein FWD42_05235, partial [Solirubrobacterales bacterium]|nr:hypothetical protein [Solirubrobacterales bacterium]
MTRPRRSTAATVASALLALGSLLGAAAAAQAQAAGAPRWKITSETLPTNLPPAAREVQQVRVYGTGGTFKLAFGGQTTAAVPFDASATEVETALDALSTIGGAGGKVLVSGGPGGPKGGESPYSVTFSGALAFKAVAQLSADSTELTGSPASATVAVAVPGGDGIGVLRVTAMNVGQGAATGVVTLSDALPAGLEASAISGQAAYEQNHESPSRMSCTLATLTCTYDEPVVPGDGLAVEVTVAVPHNAPAAVVNAATVSGGGAAAASVSQLSQVSATPAPFGVVPGSFFAETASSQAGAHVNLTTSFALTTVANAHGAPVAAGSLHDVHVALPTGLVGNTVAVGRCAQVTFYAGECPLTSLIGTASVLYTLGVGAPNWVTKPIYNLVPPEGTPVDLGFEVDKGFTVHVRGHVRTGADYGITSTVEETSAAANVLASTITIWGVPADMSGPGPEEVGVARP